MFLRSNPSIYTTKRLLHLQTPGHLQPWFWQLPPLWSTCPFSHTQSTKSLHRLLVLILRALHSSVSLLIHSVPFSYFPLSPPLFPGTDRTPVCFSHAASRYRTASLNWTGLHSCFTPILRTNRPRNKGPSTRADVHVFNITEAYNGRKKWSIFWFVFLCLPLCMLQRA